MVAAAGTTTGNGWAVEVEKTEDGQLAEELDGIGRDGGAISGTALH